MRVAFTNAVLPLLSSLAWSQDAPITTVQLDNGTFQGVYSQQYNITAYRSIQFGASTAGANRFRAPQPLPPYSGTYNTDVTFDMCPQRGMNGTEDCLYLGVYSRPWTPAQKLRPVLVVFYGGGYIRGSAAFTIPPSGYPVLNASQANDFVVVYPNYRTNAFGFLPGSLIGKDNRTDANPGLRDQDAAVRWVGRYIMEFGGDPEDVTVWGQSAGGGSAIAQSIADGEGKKEAGVVIKRALSSSPFWQKTYRVDAPESDRVFDSFADLVGCGKNSTGARNETFDAVDCLKNAPLQLLREKVEIIKDSQIYTTSSFSFGPVIDDDFLTTPLSAVVDDPSVLLPDTTFGFYNTLEGENFIPPGFVNASGAPYNSSEASFQSWLKGYLPGFNARDLWELRRLYPTVGEAENVRWNTTYTRAGVIFRDSVLACPALWFAQAAENKGSGKGYVGEYTISPAKHASDVQYWNTIGAVQTEQPLIYKGFAGAFASFFQTGDPNANKLTEEDVAGVPSLESGEQFVVQADGFANVVIPALEERCAFWRSRAKKIPI